MRFFYISVAAVCTALGLHQLRKRAPVETPALSRKSQSDPSAVARENREFFEKNVIPLSSKSHLNNQEASGRALSRIADKIETYRAGIQPFVSEITGWGTRLKVLWNLPGDSLFEGDAIPSLIRAKFDEHLFSEAKLRADLEEIFITLQADFEANQIRLIAEARAVAEDGNRVVNFPNVDDYSKKIRNRLVHFAETRAKDSAINGLITFVTATAVSIAAEQLVVRLVAATGTTAAFSGATAGGVTAAGAGGGAAAGTTVGPVGTIAGFIAGLIIGIAVDWWMTDEFKTKTTAELNQQLDTLRYTLLYGGTNQREQGLHTLLNEFTLIINQAHDEQLRTIFHVIPNHAAP